MPLSADPEMEYLARGLAAMLLEWWNRRDERDADEPKDHCPVDAQDVGREPAA